MGVDSCCIDKASTAELSEAINSMFRWYKKSKVCYAYLAEVPDDALDDPEDQSSFANARWFTRGWTLQELVGPRALVFYSRNWQSLGTKQELNDLLSSITRIDWDFLAGDFSFGEILAPSIAQIMSWAAERKTTRIEDRAYCLLGFFDISMPLLYGEGRKAFFRLQEELLKCSNDPSLFAWGIRPGQGLQTFNPQMVRLFRKGLNCDHGRVPTTGMFARSP